MQKKDLRTRVTTGTYTLPAMTALTAVLWVAPDAGSWRLWAGLIAAAWTAFQLIELNNRCTLLRVRSRMVSVTFLGLLLVLPAAHGFTPQSLVPLCVAASFRPLFGAYQKAEAQHHVFQAFLLVSLGSLLFPPLLLLLLRKGDKVLHGIFIALDGVTALRVHAQILLSGKHRLMELRLIHRSRSKHA